MCKMFLKMSEYDVVVVLLFIYFQTLHYNCICIKQCNVVNNGCLS